MIIGVYTTVAGGPPGDQLLAEISGDDMSEIPPIDRVLVIDVESGGLLPDTDAILSVAIATTHEQFSVNIADKLGNVLPGALAVNGINLERHFTTAVSPREAAGQLTDFIRGIYRRVGSDYKLWLCGHNIAFDLGFLARLYRLAGIEPVRLLGPHRTIDTHTLLWAKHAAGELPLKATSSDGAFEYYGIVVPEGERHTALGDARATLQLLKKLIGDQSSTFW